MAAVMWFRRDLRLADNPALLEACARRAGAAAVRARPRSWGPAGPVRRAYLGASLRRSTPRCGSGDPALGGPGRPGTPGGAGRQGGRRRAGARRRRLRALRPRARQRGRARRSPSRHRAGAHRVAVRRGARAGDQRRGRAVQGLHAVLPGLGRARLAGARRTAPTRRGAGWRSTTPPTSPTPSCPTASTCPRPARRPRSRAGAAFLRPGRRLRRPTATGPASTAPRGCRCT